jgi:hypothetical protein
MDEVPKDSEIPSGLPAEAGEEAPPLGPDDADPDREAPPPDDLPGIPTPGEEPSTDG